MEVAISEFHITADDFRFDWGLAEFLGLIDQRAERNRSLEAMQEKNSPNPSIPADRYTMPVTQDDEPVYSSISKLRRAFR